MNENNNPCPSCGQPASGSFCSHCGASLTASKKINAQAIVPWAAIGISVVALVISLVALDSGSGGSKSSPHSAIKMPAQTSPFALPLGSSFPATQQSASQPPDLSNLTPRQAADQLFNRIMTASENSNPQEVKRFAPMAVEAYKKLPVLDNDARYHLTLIYMAVGDINNTLDQLGKLRKNAPQHLLALILEHNLAEKIGHKKSAIKAYKDFLAAYETEILVGRPEYKDHEGSIDRFRKRAQDAVDKK